MPTVLIIGAGPNIGSAAAETFAGAGYKVALASRSTPENPSTSFKHFTFDASKPETTEALFDAVRSSLGDPSVVIYNAALRTVTPESPFQLSIDEYRQNMDINATSPYAAAKEAAKGFAKTGPGSTFIFTGNKLNVFASPTVTVFGMGKSAVAHLIRGASAGFPGLGYKFYYVDQRLKDGSATVPPGGEAHAKEFLDLAQDSKQRSWHYTFVDGQGYTEFDEK
ncbi:putative short-chain dehydrogenase [Xylariales sp. PMI_506]|nr:putative short-chain dehydrogenase [Xylariales sp. PMI_506]